MEIIFAINHQFLRTVARRWPLDVEKIRRMSVIEEGHEKHVRMASLAIVGSHSVNGVSDLHTQLLKSSLVPDFAELWPERFNSKTNGVAHRRWVYKSNSQLSAMLTRALGTGWITDLNVVRGLERFVDDRGIQEEFLAVKLNCKQRLAKVIQQTSGVSVDPASLFDVHVKRIHEYKRQLLNVFRIIHEYLRVTEDGAQVAVPRTFVFAGKAAPGYWAAKQIIKLVNDVARAVNTDPRTNQQMRVVFIPDYRVSLAEVIMPAADLSQQISTAGMEASGTGNMKLMMNGALTMGTLDGANIEIFEEAGEENIYIFGLKAEEIRTLQQHGSYHPHDLYMANPMLRRVLDTLASDRFNPQEPGLYRWIFESIVNQGDRYFLLADLQSYVDVDIRALQDYMQRELWARKALINIARSGKFSSDRTVLEYSRDIWHIPQVHPGHGEQMHLEQHSGHHGAEHASTHTR
jgi:starch phosphorylase